MSADLSDYRAKRDFTATPEPAPTPAIEHGSRFVITRHDARALHFDLRLEADGVLHSWAVPKGLPLRTGPRRLAVQTEPHPLEYLDFHGEIPAGQYGAGLMTIWDRGDYELIERKDGEWKVHLAGSVCPGEYHLVRTAGRDGRDEWLVFRSKRGGEGPPDPAERFRAVSPMLAEEREAAATPLDDPDWAVELKWDGFRALALVTGDGFELRSREGNDLTERFSGLKDLRRGILCQEAILDGEVVALDEEGRADFGMLQAGAAAPTFMVFDLLYVDGEWLDARPWSDRVGRLAEIVSPAPTHRIARSDHVVGHGSALFGMARKRGVEGVVAKRRSSPYRPGARSADWVKVKARREVEAVIGGMTVGEGARRGTFGALLLGISGESGLGFVGQVGSGFRDEELRRLGARLRAMEIPESPFSGPVEGKGHTWVRPDLRCRVRFTEWTKDGRLRHPVYAGLIEPPSAPTRARPKDLQLADGDRVVKLTNLDKVFWPRLGITKGDLIDHYLRMAPVLVPHLAGRAMIMKRFPDGWDKPFFFQHNVPDGTPEWVRRVVLSRSDKPEADPVTYAIVEDPLALAWMVNLGCIDLNPWQTLVDRPDEPTHLLIDLDPPDGLPYDVVVETALEIRDTLAEAGLVGYPKTSGAKGMHVFVPIAPGASSATVTAVAQALCEHTTARRPDITTVERMKAKRGRRVYLDAGQNGHGRSVASVYSVRPVAAASVSTPLEWDEVRAGLDPATFTIAEVARRVAGRGDLFAPVLDARFDLAALAGSA